MRPFSLELLKEKSLIAQPCEAFDSLCYLAEMTADEQDRRMSVPWLSRKKKLGQGDDDNSGFRAWMVAACLCDANRKFMAETVADINSLADSLAAANSREVTKLATIAAQVNGVGEVAVVELEKN